MEESTLDSVQSRSWACDNFPGDLGSIFFFLLWSSVSLCIMSDVLWRLLQLSEPQSWSQLDYLGVNYWEKQNKTDAEQTKCHSLEGKQQRGP